MSTLTISDRSTGSPHEIVFRGDYTDAEIDVILGSRALTKYDGFKRITYDVANSGLLDRVAGRLQQVYLLQKTHTADSQLWMDTAFANLRSLAVAPEASVLLDRAAGQDVVFAAAGPSLDECRESLIKYRDRYILVAVNTSAGALLRKGLTPDFVVMADPREGVYEGVKDVPRSTPAAACWFSNPKAVAHFDRVVTWSNNSEILRVIYKILNRTHTTQITERGSVVGCAYDIIDILNPKRVFLVGQDLTSGYSADAMYKDTPNNARRDSDPMYSVVCNDGKKRNSTAAFFTYIDTVNECMRDWRRPVYNLSSFGARFEKAIFINQGSLENILTKQAIFDFSFDKLKPSYDLSELRNYLDRVKKICSCTNYPPEKMSKRIESALETDPMFSTLITAGSFRRRCAEATPRDLVTTYAEIIRDCVTDILKGINGNA